MSCTIFITSVSGASSSASSTTISISGTISGCTGNSVDVQIGCAGQTVTGTGTVSGNNWFAQIQTKCLCNTLVTVTATCSNDSSCTTTIVQNLVCNCCPAGVTFTSAQGLCDSNNLRQITFNVSFTVPTQCSVTFQIDYGDSSSLGPPHTFGPGTNSFTETHSYPPGVYTANLIVTSPASCGIVQSVQVTPQACPPCNTNSFLSGLCAILEPIFLLLAAIGGTLFIASFGPPCLVIQPSIPAFATAFLVSALVIGIILYVICRDCICSFLLKLFGQIIFIIGIASLLFTFVPSCMIPVPFASSSTAVAASSLLVAFGAGAILFAFWYQNLKAVCPLTICDFLTVLIVALGVVIATVITVFVIMAGGASLAGLIFVIVLSLLLIGILVGLIAVNQNSGQC